MIVDKDGKEEYIPPEILALSRESKLNKLTNCYYMGNIVAQGRGGPHGGAFWDLVQLINLVQPQMEDVPHHGMEVFQPPRQELLQVKIQLVPVLQDAVAQPRSQRRVPWGQAVPGNIFFQRPVRPCAAFTAGDQRVQRRFSRAHQRSKG